MCLTFSALVRPKSKQRLLVDFKICVVELTVLWNCASKVICSLGNFAAFCSRCKAVAKKGTTTVLKVVVCSRLTGFILGLHQKPVMQHNAITRHELWSHWPVNVGDYYLGRAPRWSQRGCNGWEWTCDMHIYIYIFHVAKPIRQQPNSTWDASICNLGESKFCKFCRGLHDAFHFLVKSDDLQPPNLQVTEGEGIQTRAFEHIQYDLQQYSYFFEIKENCCFLK